MPLLGQRAYLESVFSSERVQTGRAKRLTKNAQPEIEHILPLKYAHGEANTGSSKDLQDRYGSVGVKHGDKQYFRKRCDSLGNFVLVDKSHNARFERGADSTGVLDDDFKRKMSLYKKCPSQQ